MASSYYIGASAGDLTELDDLSLRDPQPAPVFYAEYVECGDGTTRGIGWLETEWRWSVISTTDIDALRDFCTGVSGTIYIITPDIDGVFKAYSAVMVWPQSPEALHGDYFQDFAIRFVQLVEIPGSGTGTGT